MRQRATRACVEEEAHLVAVEGGLQGKEQGGDDERFHRFGEGWVTERLAEGVGGLRVEEAGCIDLVEEANGCEFTLLTLVGCSA